MQCGIGHCGHCQLGPTLVCRDGPVYRWSDLEPWLDDPGAVMSVPRRQTLAVWKFASCDGCQLSLLDCEDELLMLADRLQIAHFLEASSATVEGPYDISIVEGSITTPHDAERIQEVRRQLAGADHDRGMRDRRRHPGAAQLRRRRGFHLDRLRLAGLHQHAGHLHADQRPRARRLRAERVPDQQAPAARGDRRAPGRAPAPRARAQRVRGVQAARDRVRDGRPRNALPGPVTHAGCGAICPAYDRGCYGCYGPMETPEHARPERSHDRSSAARSVDLVRVYRTFNAEAEAFRAPAMRTRQTRSET